MYVRPERFLNLDDSFSQRETSAVWILPIPLERTTCFIRGTARGPRAILEVSYEIELYDDYAGVEAAPQYGIFTFPAFIPAHSSIQAAVEAITQEVSQLQLDDRLLVVLGGEHSITPGVVAGLAPHHKDLVLVQIDAHNDLYDTFDGTPWSHACAARRCLPYVSSLIQFGVRSQERGEVEFIRQNDQIKVWKAEAMYQDKTQRYLQSLQELIAGKDVYLTIDVDGFDPSVFPMTGTPYPGGIGWYECLALIRTIAQYAHVVAFDCVEFAPPVNDGLAYAHTAAVLVYKTINAIMLHRGKLRELP
jgi:agmatinase